MKLNKHSVKEYMKECKSNLDSKAFKVGGYSISATIIVFVILIVVNMMVSSLPSKNTQLDMSASKLYSVTTQTKALVSNLEKEVTIYWIVQSGEEDDVIEKLLQRYDDLSANLKVEKMNPDVYPTFVEKYTSSYTNNTLIVECGERYRVIGYDEIYVSENTYYTSSSSFDGEGMITSAIDYVVNEDFPKVYQLQGHGEVELADSIVSKFEKENIDLYSFSIIESGAIPAEADCVMIHAPQSDISEMEKQILLDYVENGGRLLVMDGVAEESERVNLKEVLAAYGVESEEGIVIEENAYYYALSSPYLLLPTIASNEISNPLIENNYYVIMPITKGYKINDELDETITVSELLSSSSTSFIKKAGYNLETYEKEDGDVNGSFTLGVSILKTTEKSDARMVWFASSHLLDETYNSYSSNANVELVLNSLSWILEEEDSISIRSKSLDYEYLVIDSSTAQTLQTIITIVVPLTYLGVGVVIVIRRRKTHG